MKRIGESTFFWLARFRELCISPELTTRFSAPLPKIPRPSLFVSLDDMFKSDVLVPVMELPQLISCVVNSAILC